jgi:2-phosphosulfolactate phosphatase
MSARERRRSVDIDAFPSSVANHGGRAIVAIDVIRATTMAVTAIAVGRRCLVARDVEDALAIRRRLGDALLAGEIAGEMPAEFDMNNSPADLVERTDADPDRPLVILSSSGADLMLEADRSTVDSYVACLRNVSAMARHLAEREDDVSLIGAGSRGEFREEDQLCCAWIADRLVEEGFEPATDGTQEIIDRWKRSSVHDLEISNSVGYLRRSGQLRDFDFIASHVDDLDLVTSIQGNELTAVA